MEVCYHRCRLVRHLVKQSALLLCCPAAWPSGCPNPSLLAPSLLCALASQRLGLAMSDSARRLLELLDEMEPVLLPGWQVADSYNLLHGLPTAQFDTMRSQPDQQKAAALAAVADVREADAG